MSGKYQSFKIAGSLPQWVYWVIGLVVFGVGWIAVGRYARWIALRDLSQTPDVWSDGVLSEETDYTCVPASVVMLLHDQGINATTYEVALVAGTDIFGTSGSGIVRAAKFYGFNAKEEKIGFDKFMESGLPAIIEFRVKGGYHAAYIRPARGTGAIEVKDPVDGLLVLNQSDAEDRFGGEKWDVYLFEKG